MTDHLSNSLRRTCLAVVASTLLLSCAQGAYSKESVAAAAEPAAPRAAQKKERRASNTDIVPPQPPSAETAEELSPPAEVRLWLPKFYRALHELSLSRRADHVRIAWFGDSHTTADFWTGELRRRLQERFGNGGPGFVHLGVNSTRHDQVLSEKFGKWGTEPASPASFERQDDGVFGLAGMRSEAQSGSAEAHIRLMSTALAEFPRDASIRWEVIWRLRSEHSSFTLSAGTQKPQTFTFTGRVGKPDRDRGVRVRASQLMGTEVVSKLSERIRLHNVADRPQFFGIVGELTSPGVVLDALGINGARLRTMLGWQEGAWLGELAERDPQLIVFAYGTNEVGDGTDLSRYRDFYGELLERIGESLPDADCLLIGPTERTDAEWKTLDRAAALDDLQRTLAAELGCAYHSPRQVMLGRGGQREWAKAAAPLAAADRIHLTRAGYHTLAAALDADLMASYSQIYGGPPVP